MAINYNADALSEASLNGGTLYVTALDANDKPIGGYRSLGYCSGIDISTADTKAELYSSLQSARTKAIEITTQRDITTAITLQDVQPENIAMALHGAVTSAASVVITDTETAYLGKVIPLSGAIDESVAIVVTDADTGLITYVEGENYITNQGSVYILDEQTGSNLIIDSEDVNIEYTSLKSNVVQGFTKSSVNVGLYFEGFNQANDDSIFKAWLHKVTLDPTTTYSLYSTEDFVTLTLEGSLLSSKAIQATGESKFFKQLSESKTA